MTDLAGSSFYDLLPPNLRSIKTRALSAALDRQMRELTCYVSKALIFARIDTVDEPLCDILALILDLDGYDTTLPIEVKRELLKIALRASSRKGTAAAMREVLRIVYSGANIQESFEYGGNPYLFRVRVDLQNDDVDEEKHRELTERIFAYKNVRSWLDMITYAKRLDTGVLISARPCAASKVLVHPYVQRETQNNPSVSLWAAPGAGARILVHPYVQSAIGGAQTLRLGSATATGTRILIHPYVQHNIRSDCRSLVDSVQTQGARILVHPFTPPGLEARMHTTQDTFSCAGFRIKVHPYVPSQFVSKSSHTAACYVSVGMKFIV